MNKQDSKSEQQYRAVYTWFLRNVDVYDKAPERLELARAKAKGDGLSEAVLAAIEAEEGARR